MAKPISKSSSHQDGLWDEPHFSRAHNDSSADPHVYAPDHMPHVVPPEQQFYSMDDTGIDQQAATAFDMPQQRATHITSHGRHDQQHMNWSASHRLPNTAPTVPVPRLLDEGHMQSKGKLHVNSKPAARQHRSRPGANPFTSFSYQPQPEPECSATEQDWGMQNAQQQSYQQLHWQPQQEPVWHARQHTQHSAQHPTHHVLGSILDSDATLPPADLCGSDLMDFGNDPMDIEGYDVGQHDDHDGTWDASVPVAVPAGCPRHVEHKQQWQEQYQNQQQHASWRQQQQVNAQQQQHSSMQQQHQQHQQHVCMQQHEPTDWQQFLSTAEEAEIQEPVVGDFGKPDP